MTLAPGTGALLALTVRVPSASRADVEYEATYTTARDDAWCTCGAATHGRACWHRGVAVRAGRYALWLYSPAGRAELEREARRAALSADPHWS